MKRAWLLAPGAVVSFATRIKVLTCKHLISTDLTSEAFNKKLRALLAVATVLLVGATSTEIQAAPTDYDGTWNATLSCDAGGRWSQFGDTSNVTISGGSIGTTFTRKIGNGNTETTTWKGNIEGKSIKVTADRFGAVANVVGIRRGAISGNMSVSAQAARSIG